MDVGLESLLAKGLARQAVGNNEISFQLMKN
jgi:hypothetical protein